MTYIIYPDPVFKLLLVLSPHKPYVVGGFVRDSLLQRSTFDVDLVTADALADFLPTLQSLAKNVYVTARYDSAMFSFKDYKVTLTRLRKDTEPLGRQSEVAFVKTLEDDVYRRDFTINALYADEHGDIIDYVGGMADLKAGHVRFIGDPAMRMPEDVLRILRYVRFCSLFETPMDEKILEIAKGYRDELRALPIERINHEVRQTLKLPYGEKNWQQFQAYCGKLETTQSKAFIKPSRK